MIRACYSLIRLDAQRVWLLGYVRLFGYSIRSGGGKGYAFLKPMASGAVGTKKDLIGWLKQMD